MTKLGSVREPVLFNAGEMVREDLLGALGLELSVEGVSSGNRGDVDTVPVNPTKYVTGSEI